MSHLLVALDAEVKVLAFLAGVAGGDGGLTLVACILVTAKFGVWIVQFVQ